MSDSARALTEPRAAYADVVAAPPNRVAEILCGELTLSPRPSMEHARASTKLGAGLDGPFDSGIGGPGGWWIVDEPELHLGEDVLVPDLAGWRKERQPSYPKGPYVTLAPDWICEVLSPSTVRIDRIVKTSIYAREGIGHLWMVDPLAETLEVYELESNRWVLAQTFAGSEPIRARPFHAVELEMGRWWVPQSG